MVRLAAVAVDIRGLRFNLESAVSAHFERVITCRGDSALDNNRVTLNAFY